MNKLLAIFVVAFWASFASAQVPSYQRNDFTTNLNPVARGVVTSIVQSLVSTGGISTTTATNIATAVAQQYATNNFVYVNDFGALADNGTTDNYAAIIAAIATGKEVRFRNRGTNYYESSPFILTNTTLNLSGARLKMKGTSTNFFIQFAPVAHSTNSYAGTNGSWGMTKIIGGEIWGGGSNNVATFGNRHGVWVDPYGAGNALLDTYIHGFNGIGVQVASSRPFTASLPFLTTDLAPLNLSGVVVSNCYYGWNFVGGQPSGIPSAPSDIYLAEYVRANGIAAFGNMVGIRLEAGNSSFAGSAASRNTNNFLICSNQNNGHGSWVGGTINHAGAYSILASNVSNGYIFAGSQIFFGDVYLTNCDGVIITDGELDTSAVTFGGGGRNEVRFNTYPNTAPTFTYGGTSKAVAYANNKTDGTSVTALPWDLMSTNQVVVRSTNGFFSPSTNKGAVVIGGNYSPTIAENVINGNTAFNIQAPWGNYGSFTFDAVGANRVGFTIRNGFYPWLTFASNAPLYIGESALSDLQSLSANPTYANRAYMSFMGSKITNHQATYFLGGAYDVNGNAYVTNSTGGGGGSGYTNTLFKFTLDASGGIISTGTMGFDYVSAPMTITGYRVLGDVAGTVTLNCYTTNSANWQQITNTTVSLFGTNKPSLSSAITRESPNTTGMITSLAVGDMLRWVVESASGSISRVQVFVYGVKP